MLLVLKFYYFVHDRAITITVINKDKCILSTYYIVLKLITFFNGSAQY